MFLRFRIDLPVFIHLPAVVGVVVPGSILAEGARVPGLSQVFLQAGAEFFPGLGVFGIPGHVNQLAGILAHIVELLGGPLCEGQVVKALEAGLVLIVHEQLLGGRRVHLAKGDVACADPAIGVASRPAAWLVIPDVEVFVGADGAAGIALTSLAASIVAFHGDEGGGKICEEPELCTSLVAEGGHQVADEMEIFGVLLHLFGDLQAGSLEEGGRKGAEVDHATVPPSRVLDSPGPANGQRHAGSSIVEAGLGSGKGHAVVAGNHHDGVVELASFLQGGDRAAYHRVEVFDLHEVIKQIVSDDGMVGKDRGHGDLVRVFSGSFSRAPFETAMGLVGSQPEAEGLVFVDLGEEILKVCRVVLVGHVLKY